MRRAIPTAYLIALAAVFAGVQVMLGIASHSLSSSPGASAIAMIVYVGLMVIVLAPRPDGLPRPVAMLLVTGVVVITVLVQSGLSRIAWPGYAAWHLAALQCLFVVIAVRRSPIAALLGCGLFTALTLWWSLHTVGGIAIGLRMVLAPVLFTLVAVALMRFLSVNDRRAADQTRQALALLDQAALADAHRVQAESWARDVAEIAGPPLRLAADPEAVLTEDDRARMLVAEASLRDRIRGGVLATPAMLAAIAAARSRGVQVSLLDDRGEDLEERAIADVSQAIAALGPRLHGGRLTIRARPVQSCPPQVTIAYASDDPEGEAEYLEF
ncbi:hypothetical protein [Microlunatus phosphovorus]|nr:hypothetical protein [Microlunatus phosphovorus]